MELGLWYTKAALGTLGPTGDLNNIDNGTPQPGCCENLERTSVSAGTGDHGWSLYSHSRKRIVNQLGTERPKSSTPNDWPEIRGPYQPTHRSLHFLSGPPSSLPILSFTPLYKLSWSGSLPAKPFSLAKYRRRWTWASLPSHKTLAGLEHLFWTSRVKM